MLIDFTEIPKSNSYGQTQDIFEKFCRDFFEVLGYEILSPPARGADGGIDLKIIETKKGQNGEIKIHWLVSCKHYAHSGKSITKEIEKDIRDRVDSHGCTGFIGFYSTIPHNSLVHSLEGLKNKINFHLYDNEKIESHIIGNHSMESLFYRYFPSSFEKWKTLHYYIEPVKLFDFYFNNNYSLYNWLIQEIFHSTANFLKCIRSSEDFKECLKKENIDYILIEALGKPIFLNDPFLHVMQVVIPAEIEKVTNVKIDYKTILFGMHRDFSVTYVHQGNYFFVSSYFHNILNEMFVNLKDIIT